MIGWRFLRMTTAHDMSPRTQSVTARHRREFDSKRTRNQDDCWWCGSAAARLCAGRFLLGGRLKQRRNPKICLHRSTITTITAGLAREVCESCARVRLRYVETAVQVRPDIEPTVAELDEVMSFEASITFEKMSSSRTRCRLCGQPAAFLVPDGLMCEEHTWQAAARIDWEETDPWVPIRIHRPLKSNG